VIGGWLLLFTKLPWPWSDLKPVVFLFDAINSMLIGFVVQELVQDSTGTERVMHACGLGYLGYVMSVRWAIWPGLGNKGARTALGVFCDEANKSELDSGLVRLWKFLSTFNLEVCRTATQSTHTCSQKQS
jgi:hypothetical protein